MSRQTIAEAGFADLPFEIRRIIFENAISRGQRLDTEINLSVHGESPGIEAEFSREKADSLLSGQLLRVCKLWNIECSPILYGHRTFWIKGEEIPDLLARTMYSHSTQYIEILSIGPSEFGHTEAMRTYPSLLLRLSALKRFDFSPTVSHETIEGCQAATFHWKCTALIPCRTHIMRTKEYVLRFGVTAIMTHQHLRVLIGSRRAILPVYSLIKDDSQIFDEVAANRYSKWDAITYQTLEDIEEKLARTETGWTEERDAFSSRQAF